MPQFYQDYVRQVQAIVQMNARMEFEAIWKEHEATGVSNSILSDRLSTAITSMQEELQSTDLWDNVELRRSVLTDAIPNLLLRDIGLDGIMQRVPENYLKAVSTTIYFCCECKIANVDQIFGCFLASRFIYSMGISASPVSFFAFMNQRMAKLHGAV